MNLSTAKHYVKMIRLHGKKIAELQEEIEKYRKYILELAEGLLELIDK